VIFSANSVRLSILCTICYRQRESIVTCEIVVIPMNSRSILLTCIKSLLSFNHCICTFNFLFLIFVSCLLTVTLHIVDVRLTCLINITYLLSCTFISSTSKWLMTISSKLYKKTQLSLTNRARHLCKRNVVGDLLKAKTRFSYMCYDAELGRSALQDL